MDSDIHLLVQKLANQTLNQTTMTYWFEIEDRDYAVNAPDLATAVVRLNNLIVRLDEVDLANS